MKKIIYLSLFSITLFSCDDKDIDLKPYDAFTPELTFEDKADFERAVRGAYLYLQDGNGYEGQFIIDTECMTDNVIYSPQGRGTNLDGYRWNLTASQTSFDYLEGAYRSCEMASQVINNLDNLPESSDKNNFDWNDGVGISST